MLVIYSSEIVRCNVGMKVENPLSYHRWYLLLYSTSFLIPAFGSAVVCVLLVVFTTHCIVFTIVCTSVEVHCIVCTIVFTSVGVHGIVCTIVFTSVGVHCIVCTIVFTSVGVHCIVCTIVFTSVGVHCIASTVVFTTALSLNHCVSVIYTCTDRDAVKSLESQVQTQRQSCGEKVKMVSTCNYLLYVHM